MKTTQMRSWRLMVPALLVGMLAAALPSLPDPEPAPEPVPARGDCGWVIHCYTETCTAAGAVCWDSLSGRAKPAGKKCTDANNDGCFCCQ